MLLALTVEDGVAKTHACVLQFILQRQELINAFQSFLARLQSCLMVVTHVLVPCSKAAKLILLGYNMLPPKPSAEYAKESFELLMGDGLNTAEWQLTQLVLQLTDRDIEWVIHLGFYKLAYRSVSSNPLVLALSASTAFAQCLQAPQSQACITYTPQWCPPNMPCCIIPCK